MSEMRCSAQPLSCRTSWPAGSVRTCHFCMELLNDRFVESVTDEDINVKREALTLLEGMLRLIPEERMTIKQVGRPPWPTNAPLGGTMRWGACSVSPRC